MPSKGSGSASLLGNTLGRVIFRSRAMLPLQRAGAKALTLLIAGVPGFAFASRLIHALANE
jgi:hypothetical protein